MKKMILVLDDSPFMLKVIGEILTKLNYEVTMVDNGKLACQKAASTRYDMLTERWCSPCFECVQSAEHPE